jgi:hypothetical protein
MPPSKATIIHRSIVLARFGSYRLGGRNARYDLAMGTFQLSDNSRMTAETDTHPPLPACSPPCVLCLQFIQVYFLISLKIS